MRATPPARAPMRWTPPPNRPRFLSSWLASFLIHSAVIAVFGLWMETISRDSAGLTDDSFGPIGTIYTGSGTGMGQGLSSHALDTVAFESPANASATADTAEVPNSPPGTTAPLTPITEIPLPSAAPLLKPRPDATFGITAPAGIGVGTGPGQSNGALGFGDARNLVRGSAGRSAGGPWENGMPGTAFMGTRDKGTRVVFVVDCSASMANYHAMDAAKAALLASIQTLADSQQFQVVFYNSNVTMIEPRQRQDGPLLFATEVNKTVARQYVMQIQPDLGTDHMPALKLALRFGPEVLFFLTDADEPQLVAAELDQLHRLNLGRTRIHTIEFGKGPAIDADNFLKRLARQNDGTYRYHDVKRFSAP